MKKVLLIILTFLILSGLLLVWGFNRAIDEPVRLGGKDIKFTITKGDNVDKISRNLEDAGLVSSASIFSWYVRIEKLAPKFKAGDYILNPSLSTRKVADMLSLGRTVSAEKTIKVIEGWNMKDIDEYLHKNNLVNDSYLDIAKKSSAQLKDENKIKATDILSLIPAKSNLEGFLYPDTYRAFADANSYDIINKQLNNFSDKLTQQMRDDIAKQNRKLYDVVIMASIIEKEAKVDPSGKTDNSDAKIVSGVFWDRIKNGQRLESCATLAYVLGVDKEQYTLEDTQIDSPYNTYRRDGLPPGPIGNPSIEAIKAAIYPIYTDYNYFLNTSDRKIIFSKSYDEHLRNKAKYLK